MIVIGVDISVNNRLALADNMGNADSILLKSGKGGEELHDTAHRTAIFARQFANGRPITAVAVEQPMGKFHNPSLVATFGVVSAAIYGEMLRLQQHPVVVWPINISTWKKRAVGHGNATKDQVAEWCKRQGLVFANQDEADALAIAHAAFLMVETIAA